MKLRLAILPMVALLLATAYTAEAQDVFNMPTGLTSLETVSVGNPGTTGYGAVDYAYRIGKFEVTAAQYTEFLNAVAATDTYGLYDASMWSSDYACKIERSGSAGSYSYSVASDWANRPVNYISWGDAARLSNWLHNGQPTGGQDLTTTEDGSYYLNGATNREDYEGLSRESDATWVIPTENEWHKAAYHKNDGPTNHYWMFPTGSDDIPSNDVTDPDGGNNANHESYAEGDRTLGAPYWRTEVGEFENSPSPYGTFDQGGNVWEFNESTRSGGLNTRGMRGGGFSWDHGPMADYFISYNVYPTTNGSEFGIRVAYVPEPATMSLLGLGCLAALRKKRK